MEQTYRKQVALLLDVLPEVAKESCFALHGGTAITYGQVELYVTVRRIYPYGDFPSVR